MPNFYDKANAISNKLAFCLMQESDELVRATALDLLPIKLSCFEAEQRERREQGLANGIAALLGQAEPGGSSPAQAG